MGVNLPDSMGYLLLFMGLILIFSGGSGWVDYLILATVFWAHGDILDLKKRLKELKSNG